MPIAFTFKKMMENFFLVPFLVVSFLWFFFSCFTLICLQVSISFYLDLQNDRVKGMMLAPRCVTVPGRVFSLLSLSWFLFPSHGTSFLVKREREQKMKMNGRWERYEEDSGERGAKPVSSWGWRSSFWFVTKVPPITKRYLVFHSFLSSPFHASMPSPNTQSSWSNTNEQCSKE